MRVGVEETGGENLVKERACTVEGEEAGLFGRERRLVEAHAFDEVHHEHAFAGELLVHGRGVDGARERIGRVEVSEILGLVAEVEFACEGDAHLGHDGRQVVGRERGDAVVELRDEERDQVEISVDHLAEVGPLQLHRDEAAVAAQAGAIDLCEGGGGDGGLVELGEDGVEILAEFLDKDRAHFCEGERFDVVLKFSELEDERLGNDIGPHAEELAGLDEGRPELLGGEAETFPDAALARLRNEALEKPRRRIDLLNDFGKAVLGEDRGDLLGANGVGEEVEGGHAGDRWAVSSRP